MAKQYEIKSEMQDEDHANSPSFLIYNPSAKGWFVTTKAEKIDYKVISPDEWYKYKAGEIKHIFPQYNPETQYVSADTNRPEHLHYEGVGMNLMQYKTTNDVGIPYGCFIFKDSFEGVCLQRLNIQTDKYIDIGRTEGQDLYNDYLKFLEHKPIYEQYNRRARKGCLLYGPPGNSKTTEICRLAAHAEANKFRVFFIGSKEIELSQIDRFKNVFDKENNVFVLEEITERISQPEELLSFLDGEMSWNNCYTIATTNHPEQLPWNIIDRPGRFKMIKEFGPPNAVQRTKYLKQMPFSTEEIEEAVNSTEGLSFDYLINIAFDSITNDEPLLKVIDQYKNERKKLSSSFRKPMGM